MNTREKMMWMQQLAMVSSQIESMDGDAGMLNLLTTVAAMSDQIAREVPLMSRQDQERMLPSFYQLAKACETYSSSVGWVLGDTSDLDLPVKELDRVKRAGEKLQADLEGIRKDIERQKTLNSNSENAVKAGRNVLESEKERTEEIRRQLEQYSPEELAKVRKETARLHSELEKASGEKALLERDRQTAESELANARENVESVRREIETFSESTRRALRTFNEKRTELQALQTAEVDCSPEKQAELTEKIESLRPEVEKRKAEMKVLTTEYTSLEEMRTDYDKNLATVTSNVFTILHDHVNELQTALDEQKKTLFSVEKKAQTLQENMEKAAKKRDELKAWFDMECTPLEAMCARVSGPDSEMLRRELDPGKIAEVRELMADIEGQITKLDTVLERCFQAAAQDQAALRRKTPR